LASVGIPQHDLAEFLCFVLSPNSEWDVVSHWIQYHRECLEEITGCAISPGRWSEGFNASLKDLLVHRFSMYSLVHRFHPQEFFPQTLKTWRRLYELINWYSRKTLRGVLGWRV